MEQEASEATALPESLTQVGTLFRRLAYGENKDSSPAAFYRFPNDSDPLGLSHFDSIGGDLSYNALCGVDRGLNTISLMAEAFRACHDGVVPAIAIVCKHGNPCGAAFSWTDPAIAVLKALRGDPVAVMGGEFICNFPINDTLAKLLSDVPDSLSIGRLKWGLDVITAPALTDTAVGILHRKKNPRKLNIFSVPKSLYHRILCPSIVKICPLIPRLLLTGRNASDSILCR